MTEAQIRAWFEKLSRTEHDTMNDLIYAQDHIGCRKRVSFLFELIDSERLTAKHLRDASAQAEQRIREETQPLVDAMNRLLDSDLITDEEKLKMKHAWKWAVYGAAIHLQVALTAFDGYTTDMEVNP